MGEAFEDILPRSNRVASKSEGECKFVDDGHDDDPSDGEPEQGSCPGSQDQFSRSDRCDGQEDAGADVFQFGEETRGGRWWGLVHS